MTYDSIMRGFNKMITKLDRLQEICEERISELRDRKVYIDTSISNTEFEVTKIIRTSGKLKELVGV